MEECASVKYYRKGHLQDDQQNICRSPIMYAPPYRPFLRFLSSVVLGRDPDWIDLNIRTTIDVMKGGVVIGLFPRFMRG